MGKQCRIVLSRDVRSLECFRQSLEVTRSGSEEEIEATLKKRLRQLCGSTSWICQGHQLLVVTVGDSGYIDISSSV